MDYKAELLKLYDEFPFHNHPLWRAVLGHELTYQQVIKAEVQHCIRTKEGKKLREEAVGMAKVISEKIWEQLVQTYLEECTHDASGPSHLELIRRLVTEGGFPEAELDHVPPTPGNSAAIALYRDITIRGAGCHMLGAGAVEFYYSKLSRKIFDAYIGHYGMTPRQAETYHIHGPMDESHAERAFMILDEAVSLHGWDVIKISVRDAFVATSLHYDGMLQGATGKNNYWNGSD